MARGLGPGRRRPRRRVTAAARAPAPQRQPLLDRRASGAVGPGRSRRLARAASRRSRARPGSWRTSTLWIILRRSRKPAWTSRQSSSSRRRVEAARPRLAHEDGRVDLRARARRRPPGRRRRRARRRGTGRRPRGSSWRPGGAAIRSATSRWTMSTKRSGRGSSSRTWWRMGLVMWYGHVGHERPRAVDDEAIVDVEEVARDEPEAGRARRSARAGARPGGRRARPR